MGRGFAYERLKNDSPPQLQDVVQFAFLSNGVGSVTKKKSLFVRLVVAMSHAYCILLA